MNAEFDRIGLRIIATAGEGPSRGGTASVWFMRGLLWLLAAAIIGFAVWMAIRPSQGKVAQTEPVKLALAAVDSAPSATAPESSEAEAASLEGLRISSQTWRRGGLGSKALVTFTLRNDNDYAVKDIAITCAFTRRDGSHLSDRSRVLADTVSMKSRKTFARVPIGFVNVNADQAKCSLVTARRA